MGGKTARACDGCLRKRARWYCLADDAFLCQACDTSVHSANQLASRHERVRLETSSSSKFHGNNIDAPPAWHQGFTRKARTPRHNNKSKAEGTKLLNSNPFDPLVPELGSEDGSVDETEEQLLCRVPVFDPFDAELCHMPSHSDGDEVAMLNEVDDGLHGLLPSDIDLAEFAADVESLLGLDEEDDIKGIELLDSKQQFDDTTTTTNFCEQFDDTTCFYEHQMVKVKDEEDVEGLTSALNWSFDYESPLFDDDEEEKLSVAAAAEMEIKNEESKAEMKRKMLLSLNYESVITAWASHGSPWTTGSRPEFNPDDFMGSNAKEGHYMNGGLYSQLHQARGNTDGEREARVSRYREKRRTRLFSKKIRYEVRKLNAEKRPRMKGRFVKRTSSSFMGSTANFPYSIQ
ncbi:Zinc finger, B-box [Corchorus capsularis]|uniref:Zinc finger, B-box n=1 Tax=Corchorus capsularis TaxID=210143 RepID=A0A1R3J4S0_COCAP|nr:Zinc finger, B-box [Corchorus capsularis]